MTSILSASRTHEVLSWSWQIPHMQRLTLQSQGQAFLIVVAEALWAVFYQTSSRQGYGGEGGPRQLTAELASREIVARLPHAGDWCAYVVRCSGPAVDEATGSAWLLMNWTISLLSRKRCLCRQATAGMQRQRTLRLGRLAPCAGVPCLRRRGGRHLDQADGGRRHASGKLWLSDTLLCCFWRSAHIREVTPRNVIRQQHS